MGGPESEGGGDEERPVHQVNILDGFLMAKYEITVVAYEACKSDGNCTASSTSTYDGAGWGVNRSDKGRQIHPQNGLTKTQTEEFCAWNATGGRLPSEAEWEYAASGNEEHRIYPWGNSPEPNCDDGILNFNPQGFELSGYGCENGGTFPVGSFVDGASPFGILDMAGNVWEWVQDCQHDTYEGAPIDGSAWIEDCVENYRFIQRGGGFLNPAIQQRNAARISSTLYKARAQVGGRCVRPLP
jgi:formylglycine-generating enzyme required for sulfatase activity